MLRMSTGVVTLFIVSLAGLACANRSGLDLLWDGGGKPSGGSSGTAGAGGTGGVVGGLGGAVGNGGLGSGGMGGNQTGSGGISGAGGCIPPPCVLLECLYGYAPSSSPCGCGGGCAPPPDAGRGGAGAGGAIGSGGNGGKKDASADASPDGSPDLHVCGPVCAIYCEYGNAVDSFGCPTCQCKAAPGCPTGSHAVTCPPDTTCAADCAEYQRGSDGCQLCACQMSATCAPPGTALCIYCPFGYRSGPGGCITCSCADPPIGCAANSSDAGA